jgi:hypothetical protein
MIFIYKMASGVRMSKNWIPRLRFLFLSFSQYVADYSDPRSRPFLYTGLFAPNFGIRNGQEEGGGL